MKVEKKAAKLLRRYMRWPLWITLIILAATFGVFLIDRTAGYFMAGFAIIAVLFTLVVYLASGKSIMKALVGFAMSNEDTQNMLVMNLDVPYAIMDQEGFILWRNNMFEAVLSEESTGGKEISSLFHELDPDRIASIRNEEELHLSYREKRFRVVIKHLVMDGQDEYCTYLYDETALVNSLEKIENDRAVVGLIYIDNYDEVLESVEDVKRSMLLALVDRQIAKFISDNDGIVTKSENDKYVFVIRHMYLEQIETARFDILEDVKKINIGNEMSVTISIGVGLGAESYADNYEQARKAIDMALARGGDQAVIREGDTISYFGGKSKSVEKATRVKARVKAHAFEELLSTRDKLLIMGHTLMDIDSLGSAIGIWRIATSLGKKAYIIKGRSTASIDTMIQSFNTSDYPADVFIDKSKAMELADEDCALVVVDVNRPSITEAPELLDVIKSVVVFDHHRQSSEIIEQATLSYIEPYASSASEMVADMMQYITGDIKPRPAEADAMYAGIVIDTHNFTNQTGVKTFEAAAFLKRCGADVTRVRKLFRDDVDAYRAKAKAIDSAEIYEDAYAMTALDGTGLESPTVICAQTANELLDMVGIKASFVFTEYNNKIYISARSIDEVNVQIIMEKLDGGGHRTIAGAQMENVTVGEAMEKVKALITDMIKKGELEK